MVAAEENSRLLGIGGAVAGGNGNGVGLSLGLGLVTRTVDAYIGNDATVTALGNGSSVTDPFNSSLSGHGVVIDATLTDNNMVFGAGVGIGASGLGVAASAVVDDQTNDTEAYVGQGALVNANNTGSNSEQSIFVHAADVTSNVTVGGSFAAGDGVGVGAAADVETINRTVKAYIGASTVVNAADDVVITAAAPVTISTIAAGLAGSLSSVALAGSAAVLTLTNDTEAFVDNDAQLHVGGTLSLSADRFTNITSTGGAGGLSGGKGGIGVTTSTIVETDTTLATLGCNDQVTALGQGAGVAATDGSRDSNNNLRTPLTLSRLILTAVAGEDLLSIAVGAFGGSSAGVAGSATVNLLTETTKADIGSGSQINTSNVGAGSSQGAYLLADDPTTLNGAAGGLSGGGTAGVGAGAHVLTLSKDTEAFVGSSTTMNVLGSVNVQAISSETLLSIAAELSGAGDLTVDGSVSVIELSPTTIANIGNNDTVTAGGSVQVAAIEADQIGQIAGNLSGSGEVSVGASVAILILDKTTEAFIGTGASVTAGGTGSALTVDDGQFTTDYTTSPSANGVALPALNNSQASDPGLTGQASTSFGTQSLHGVAVTAVSQDSIVTSAISGGAAGSVAVQLVGAVTVPTVTTNAYVGNNATVNSGTSGSASSGSVLVVAGEDFSRLGIAGAVSAAGEAAVDPGADVTTPTLTTTATVGQSAQVNAVGDMQVVAAAAEKYLSVAAGLAVSGTASAAGAVTVLLVNDTTNAYIENGAMVDVGGNLLVAASDDTDLTSVAGTVAIGFEGGGVAGSVAINDFSKDTQAGVQANAIVNALGNSSNSLPAPDGQINSGTAEPTSLKGLAVEASSYEHNLIIVAGGAGGFCGGLAGSVSVEIDKSATDAFIGKGASINGASNNASAAGSSQSVNVSAQNDAQFTDVAGSGAGGFGVGLSGGVDVGVIKNTTTSSIGNNTSVHARDNVSVNAVSTKTVSSTVVSAAAGAFGVAGAVSVWDLGRAFDPNSQRSLQSNDGLSASTGSYADSQINTSGLTGEFSGFNGSGSDSNQDVATGVSNASAMANSAMPSDEISDDLNDNDDDDAPSGTAAASIGNSTTVIAGGNISINGQEELTLTVNSGSAAVGIAGFGGSVAVITIDSTPQATIGSSSTISAGNAGTLRLDAGLSENSTGNAYGGSGGLVGLGAQVVYMTDDSTPTASVGSYTAIPQAGAVLVTATASRDLNSLSIGGAVARGRRRRGLRGRHRGRRFSHGFAWF